VEDYPTGALEHQRNSISDVLYGVTCAPYKTQKGVIIVSKLSFDKKSIFEYVREIIEGTHDSHMQDEEEFWCDDCVNSSQDEYDNHDGDCDCSCHDELGYHEYCVNAISNYIINNFTPKVEVQS